MSADSAPISETPTGDLSSEAAQEATNASVAGATGVLAMGNIVSRILGLAREKTLAYFFGASAALDAFQVAILVPKIFYDLLIGGHVNGAIVPVLSEIVTVKGKDELWRVVSILVSLLTMFVSLLVIVIELFAPQFAQLAAGGYDAQTLALATTLLRITAPALIFLSLFAIFSGTLYALNEFRLPALAGVVFNASIVLVTIAFAPPLQVLLTASDGIAYMQPVTVGRPAAGITAAALGWFLGAVVQMLLQLPGIQLSNLRISFNWRHPALKGIALLYAPVMFSLVMDALVIRFFSYNLATQSGINGGISYMNFATTLIQFPQGLVATAISIAILPTLSGQAVKKEGEQAFRDTLGLGIRLTTTLIIPAAVGLFVLATPIIMLLFEGGEFTAQDTQTTALALRLYLIGLPFAAVDLLLVYAFYARKDTLTPALIGLFSHGVYIAAVLLLFERFSLFSLMIADSLKHIVHAAISALLLRHRLNGFGAQRFWTTTFKTTFAAAVMGVFAWVTVPWFTARIGTANVISELLLVLVSAGTSGGLFLVLALLLQLEELRWIAGLIRDRLFPA